MAVIEPAEDGGSTLHITWDRQGKSVFGKLFVGLMALTRGILIRRSFEMGLAKVAAMARVDGGSGSNSRVAG